MTATTAKRLEGRCACGAVKYRLGGEPMFVHCCHCLDCQRITGSAFVINLWIEGKLVEADHSLLKSYRLKGGSGADHDVFFCPACGTTMWSKYQRAGESLFVRAGTLEDPSWVKPDVYIFTRSKLPWVRLPEGANVFEAYYDLRKLWPAESIERLRQVAPWRT